MLPSFKSKKRVGILGGTFDPIHMGHLMVAQHAWEEVQLDAILFVPARSPWMKVEHELAPVEDRLAMVRLAVGVVDAFGVSHLEVDRSGPSYTVDTLAALRQAAPEWRLFLILGADAASELGRWKEPGKLLGMCEVVVAPRPGYVAKDGVSLEDSLASLGAARTAVQQITGPRVDISATDIRRRVKAGRSIRYLVPEAVEVYIRLKGLYRGESGVSGAR